MLKSNDILPSVSVIIPTYKRDNLLINLVENFADVQEIQIDEIIIIYSVDKEYADNTFKIRKKLFDLSTKNGISFHFEVVSNSHTINAKRNIGIKRSNSEFVLLFDDDNEINTRFVYNLKALLNNYDAVTGLTIENGINITAQIKSSYDIMMDVLRHKWGEGDSFTIAVNSGFIAVKRTWFDENGLLDENYVYSYDDYDLGWRLWQSNTPVFKSKILTINHLKAGGGSRSRFINTLDIMKIYSKAYFVRKHFKKKVAMYSLIIDLIEHSRRRPLKYPILYNILLAMKLNYKGSEALAYKMKTLFLK